MTSQPDLQAAQQVFMEGVADSAIVPVSSVFSDKSVTKMMSKTLTLVAACRATFKLFGDSSWDTDIKEGTFTKHRDKLLPHQAEISRVGRR